MPNKDISVLHVSGAKSWRGGEAQIELLMREQDFHGYKISLFAPLQSPFRQKQYEFPITFRFAKRRLGTDPVFALHLQRMIHKEQPDILHLHDPHAHTAAVLALTFISKKPKVILHRRVVFSPKKDRFTQWKYNHPAIQKVICISEAVKKVMMDVVRDSNKLEVVYSAVDPSVTFGAANTSLRKRLSIPEEVAIIAHVAALTKEKGHFRFLEIATQFIARHSECKVIFLVFGEGPLRSILEQMIKDRGLKESVILMGFERDVRKYMKEFDLLVFPSQKEGLGTSVIEAQMAGIPAMVHDSGGLSEVIQDGYNGYLVKEDSVEPYIGLMAQILSHSGLYHKLSQNAVKHMSNFEPSKMFERMDAIYQSLLYSSSSK